MVSDAPVRGAGGVGEWLTSQPRDLDLCGVCKNMGSSTTTAHLRLIRTVTCDTRVWRPQPPHGIEEQGALTSCQQSQ
jgi:hypothetical protein